MLTGNWVLFLKCTTMASPTTARITGPSVPSPAGCRKRRPKFGVYSRYSALMYRRPIRSVLQEHVGGVVERLPGDQVGRIRRRVIPDHFIGRDPVGSRLADVGGGRRRRLRRRVVAEASRRRRQ